MWLLLTLCLFIFMITPTDGFKDLLCNYSLDQLSVKISRKDLINGFTKMDKIDCLKELSPTSFWFTIIRNGEQSDTKMIKYEQRKQIPSILKQVEKGDIINFSIMINQPYLQRRDKTIEVI